MAGSSKILVIRFSSIGDIVLTTPLVRGLKQQGRHVVHYLTKKQFLPVLKANPYIDKIHILEDGLGAVVEELKKENFGFIVDLHKNLRSFRVKKALGKPSASFNKLNRQKWLLVNFRINALPDIHIVDRYFEAAMSLGVINDLHGLDYFIPQEDQVDMNGFPEGFRNGYIAFVIGGKHKTKVFPAEKVIPLCSRINYPVVLLGGPDDTDLAEVVMKSTGSGIFNAVGKYNLNQSASIVKQAKAVITNDTGLMHIAAAFQKPVASLWGNTVPEFGMYPYMPGTEEEKVMIAEVKGLKCRPCSKIGFEKCPKKHFRCMMDINEEAILEFLEKFIRK